MDKPLIYQILPRIWGNLSSFQKEGGTLLENGCGKFSSIDGETLSYIRSTGFSHVWYTGIIRHATEEDSCGCIPSSSDWVKGRAGSPYSITDYYDVNPYLSDCPERRMDEFKSLIKRTHEAGLKVIIDFVPNHVARDYGRFSERPDTLGRDDDTSVHWRPENDFFYYPGTPLTLPMENQTYMEYPARATGNNYSPTPGVNDWYDTIKLNYCDFHTGTWNKMLDIVRFWASEGVDGFRCDMVELVPPEFFKWLISKVKAEFPEILFIAEVYQKSEYGKYIKSVGFDLLYDKSGMYDTLRNIVEKNVDDAGVPVEEWQSARKLTWNWQDLGDLQPYMLNFLENHDEQRFASDFFGHDPRKCFAALHVALFFNTSAFMLYFGEEAGERGMDREGFSSIDGRTSIFDWWTPEGIRRLNEYVHGRYVPEGTAALIGRFRSLVSFAAGSMAVRRGGTFDLCYCNLSSDGFDKDRHFAFLRHYKDETLLIVSNFSKYTSRINLVIPEIAMEWMGREKASMEIHVEVPGYDGIIIGLPDKDK